MVGKIFCYLQKNRKRKAKFCQNANLKFTNSKDCKFFHKGKSVENYVESVEFNVKNGHLACVFNFFNRVFNVWKVFCDLQSV